MPSPFSASILRHTNFSFMKSPTFFCGNTSRAIILQGPHHEVITSTNTNFPSDLAAAAAWSNVNSRKLVCACTVIVNIRQMTENKIFFIVYYY